MAICSPPATTLVPHRTSVLLLAALLIPTIVYAADFSGPVVAVLDGDTLEVLNGHHAERIRLQGIDCPEKGQAFGQRAKQAASELVFGKKVTIQMHGYDKYKRTLGDVFLSDGTHVNHVLVENGWCWWYSKYATRGCCARRVGENRTRGAERLVG
ncbi:MAG: thermonuclease family protein [Nitrospiraceae bacterium]|nr:thermonuclease family protein [Nitrospiraceae bacterium]